MIYLLLEARAMALPRIVATAREIEGVDLVMWLEDGRAHIAGERGELTFHPGDGVADDRGLRWDVDGELDTLLATIEDGVLVSEHYPDALRRVWSALRCKTSGDVLLSAEPAYEFPDWGNRAHVRGGSHGSLHRVDSLGALLFCGIDCRRRGRGRWATSRQWCSGTSAPGRFRGHDRRGLRGAGREAPPRRRKRTRVRRALRPRRNWLQLIRFGAVGASGYAVNLAVFTAAVHGAGFGYGAAAVMAFIVALANNFFWNRAWTFKAGDGHAGFQAARFVVVSLAAFGFNLLLLFALVEVAGVRGAGAGDRDRRRDAAELPRQQALELPDVMRAACCAALLTLLLARSGRGAGRRPGAAGHDRAASARSRPRRRRPAAR